MLVIKEMRKDRKRLATCNHGERRGTVATTALSPERSHSSIRPGKPLNTIMWIYPKAFFEKKSTGGHVVRNSWLKGCNSLTEKCALRDAEFISMFSELVPSVCYHMWLVVLLYQCFSKTATSPSPFPCPSHWRDSPSPRNPLFRGLSLPSLLVFMAR